MAAKFVILVFGVFLLMQNHNVYGKTNGESELDTISTAPKERFSNENANQTIEALLYYVGTLFIYPSSAAHIRNAFTNIRTVLTNSTGLKNAENITKMITFLLKDRQSASIIIALCEELDALVYDQMREKPVVTASINTFSRVMHHEGILPATEGFIEGIEFLLKDLNEQQLIVGLQKLKTLTKLVQVMNSKRTSPSQLNTVANEVRGIYLGDLHSGSTFPSQYSAIKSY